MIPAAPTHSRRLSVVVCTHNRSADTLACLRALHPQLAGSATELLLVDSASSQAERDAVEGHLGEFPGVRYIRLDTPGSSIARNAGVEASTGQWVAFIDDDAVPHPDWHERIIAALERVPDSCGAIGGRVLPLFPDGPVPHLGPRWRMYLSIVDGTGARDCTENFEIVTANCCFRRAALDQAGGFTDQLGRIGSLLLSGDEIIVARRMRGLGWRLHYDGGFCVGHKVSPARLQREWVRQRAYWEGITNMRMARLLEAPERTRLPLKAALAAPVLGLLSRLNRPEQEWDLRFWYDWGVVVEALGFIPRPAEAESRRGIGKNNKQAAACGSKAVV